VSGAGIYELGGYCMEDVGVSTEGEAWWYDSNTCTIYHRYYSGGSNTTCSGEHVTPVGIQVASVTHSNGTLTPTGTNKLFDTGIRFIDSNNNAVFIVTEWHTSLFDLEYVHILCDCTFEAGATEVIENEILIDENTEINIFFDSSGSMNSTLSPLQTMRSTILKECLLPFYNNDGTLYDQNVTITSIGDERTFDWLSKTATGENTTKVINLAFTDENTPYNAGNGQSDTLWQTVRTGTYNNDILQLRNVLSSAPNTDTYRSVIFRVNTGPDSYNNFKNFLIAVKNGTYLYSGVNGLSDKSEVGVVPNVTEGSNATYYANVIIDALNNLGYNVPNCN
jgi:hypothetical protein